MVTGSKGAGSVGTSVGATGGRVGSEVTWGSVSSPGNAVGSHVGGTGSGSRSFPWGLTGVAVSMFSRYDKMRYN